MERYERAAESQRLLRAAGSTRDGSVGHGGVTDRAQRMAANGEALRYIELVLRQLRRASRDHRRLVRQRHADFRYEIGEGSTSRFEGIDERVRRYRDRRDDLTDMPGISSRSSSGPWESDLASRKARRSSEYPRPDVTTRLLTKRRDYGGTAQNIVDILRPTTRRIQDEITAAAYQDLSRVPEDVGWKSAREIFGSWSLSETLSSNDRRTSSTVV